MRRGRTTLQVMPRLELVKKVRPSLPRLRCEASGDWLVRMIFSFTQQISAEHPLCWSTGGLVLNRTKWVHSHGAYLLLERISKIRKWFMIDGGQVIQIEIGECLRKVLMKMWNLSWAVNDKSCQDGQEECSRQMFSERRNLQHVKDEKTPRRASLMAQNPPANAGD